MKKLQNKQKGPSLILYRVLLGLVFALVLGIAFGTVYAVLKRPPVSVAVEQAGETGRIFTGMGRIRASTGGDAPATVILAVSFPYDPDDRFFVEELSARVGDFRRISLEYFASLNAGELARLDEAAIKAELLRRYNAGLRLGKIGRLYFNEFMVLE
ncbi:MAG: flagellar basal body protein FliL [Spirochaetaceae bacterium]|jgi:flagellar basal body-associated protein FliL|nr:flagellar basal body protein FliL [Spirochaetaceae bacterium]